MSIQTPAPVAPGDVLAGKYRVERVLGKGGMGMVVSAMHLQLDKRVALKFLLPEMAQNPELVQRFSREARAASRIESEHVAKVVDVGQLEGGAPYMVMEYLEGSDLADVVKARGALPGQEAIDYVLQACEALAEAHVAGIVHRDLKPANLFLTRRADGSTCVKVLDFGISKIALASDQGQGMTQTSALMGSPAYMAPEQLRSARNVDARADIWSLGIILQELLTGETAFKADTVPELYVSILQAQPIPLRSRRPDAPPAMEAIVARCLQKDPAQRFADVGELARALADMAPASARISIERIQRVVGGSRGNQATSMAAAGPAMSMYGQGTPQPSYGPPAPQPSYPPAAPPPAYGQVTPQQGGAYGPSYGMQPGYAPQAPPGFSPPVQAQRQGMPAAQVALIAVIATIVVLFGTCTMCVCIGAANEPRGKRSEAPNRPPVRLVTLVGDGTKVLGAFQRPAGWTTVSRGASSRPLPGPHSRSAWDAAWQARAVLSRSSGRAGHRLPGHDRGSQS